ncbi:MAG: hypothetical protein M0Q53_07955 [Prolixibacteraceae bacterium]|jgi:hypothetical protein|nr:hypothetical protein [Prolixibacteraceae bacterium]
MVNLRKNLSNVFGWRTKRKIVVIESDDWGSIRTRSKKDYDAMLSKGLELDRSIFTKYDCLESNADLENLFEVLFRHKDFTGRPVVFTPMSIMANPSFEKIKASGFSEYAYEPFTETCKSYPNHDRVHALWQKGIKERLFVPALHGREHLNVSRWMKELRNENEGLRLAFEHQSVGASWYKGCRLPAYLAAFDPETEVDIQSYTKIIETGAAIFQSTCGYEPRYFIASNSPEPKSLEKVLKMAGVDYLTRYKFQKYPLGNGKFSYELNWLGKHNKQDQVILTRNCGFEPSDPSNKDWVDACMSEIENAFKWHKPAIVSSHRVNYVGFIHHDNAAFGLKELDRLLTNIINRWPDVEFMQSVELGDLIDD